MKRVLAVVLMLLGPAETSARELLMPVPARSILPGQALKADDFRMKLFDVSDIAATRYVLDIAQLNRMAAAKGLAEGKPVPLRAIRTLHDAVKGRPTSAVYASQAIRIEAVLIPMADAAAGETITARNAATGGRVTALVLGDGTLLVVAR
jgi:flagellar basal body P-ring formation protein FlgA